MPSLTWNQLRPWGGSQHNAFEELCCQLAAHEAAPVGAEYRRVGAPDAGVECIWSDPNGAVRAWQAKYFLQPPTSSQWGQLDDSVHQAVEHYPKLTRYTICLPIDRPDARLEGQSSMMEKWDERALRWTQYAAARGRQVTFDYWGEHEIADRLSRAEHAGRRYFWFNTYALGPEWFRERFTIARANAGPRYSPELHVDLAISSTFDALARHPRFLRRLQRRWGDVRREAQRAIPVKPGERRGAVVALSEAARENEAREAVARDAAWTVVSAAADSARQAVTVAGAAVAALEVGVPQLIPFDTLRAALSALRDALGALYEAMDDGDAAAQATLSAPVSTAASQGETSPKPTDAGASVNRPSGHFEGRARRHSFDSERYHHWRARSALDALDRACRDANAAVANVPALLVRGQAGTGKTHLFCDVTERAVAEAEPCVLLLGEQIVKGDPWPQLLQQLQLDCRTADEFLGALSAAAEAVGRRAVVLIDALNEGEGRDVWPQHLAGMLATIARYPWVAIAVSVRTSYAEVVVRDAARQALTAVEHRGFAEREVDATRRFFDSYGLERPSVPLLAPEFANPLFLKLFCQGLKNRGLKRVPLGLEGISAVFSFFLSSVHERLAAQLDFDVQSPVVERAVSALAAEMRNRRAQWVPRERARELIETVLPSHGRWEHSLMRQLISEGVLSEEMVWDEGEDQRVQAIRFTYERLGDHRVAALLLDGYLAERSQVETTLASVRTRRRRPSNTTGATPTAVGSSLSTDANASPLTLADLLYDEMAAWYWQGVLNALAIQVPERTGRELWELAAPEPGESQLDTTNRDAASAGALTTDFRAPLVDAFLSSLEWRRPDAIGPTALRIVDRYLRLPGAVGERIRDLVMGVAARPGHPLNADYLDANLARESMPDRDSWWSIYLADQSDASTPTGRLIDWAWRAGREAQHADEALILAAVALAWTLTTSQRQVRDHATKGLVSILQQRPHLLRRVLERFSAVNDPYVAERLYAVAYGCAMRGVPRAELEALAHDVYATIFAAGNPPPHLLLRDYARGIVELATAEGLLPSDAVERARPPYQSDPPGPAPSEDELRARYDAPFKPGEDDGYFSLLSSLGSMGDFARYIVGTNSHSFGWSARPIYGPHPATKRERYDSFVDGLPRGLRERWRELQRQAFLLQLPRLSEALVERGMPPIAGALAIGEANELIEAGWRDFRGALPEALRAEFDEVRHWGNEPLGAELFDLQYALRWLFHRVIALGWTPERFGAFDRRRGDYEGRMSHRSERIGKKYQWIAWHEFTARVADNFSFRSESWTGTSGTYRGPWQLFRRDIDPSYLHHGGSGPGAARRASWWKRDFYSDDSWRRLIDDAEWLVTTGDLPRVDEVIQAAHPDDGSGWWWLCGDAEWREPDAPDEEPYERARRSIRYWITAVVVRAEERDRLVKWARGRDLAQIRLDEMFSPTQVFLGEHPWAPAFRTQYGTSLARPWTRLEGRLPVPVLLPAVTYAWESNGYDRSIDSAVNLSLPSPALLAISGKVPVRPWPRPRATALYYNPSLSAGGPDALLARAEVFRLHLDRHRLDVVWLMNGEKQLIGDLHGRSEDWKGRLGLSAVGCFAAGQWREWHFASHSRGEDSLLAPA